MNHSKKTHAGIADTPNRSGSTDIGGFPWQLILVLSMIVVGILGLILKGIGLL